VLSVGDAGARLQQTCALTGSTSRLRYVSGRREEALGRLGLGRVRDLLLHLPHRYLDFTRVSTVAGAELGQDATILGTVDRVRLKRPRPRMQIVEVSVLDATGVLMVTFFRQPWVADQLKQGEEIAVSGKVTFAYGFKQMRSPFYEVLDAGAGAAGAPAADAGAAAPADAASYARVLPVHPVAEGVSPSWMRRIVSCALADAGDVCDPVPVELVCRHGLMGLRQALREVHFPHSVAGAERARRRLAYDELLCLQLALLTRQRIDLGGVEACAHVTDGPHLAALVDAMPFSLTAEQRAAADEILSDMAAPRVMSRLLLGDVGTGKTAVAALGVAVAADTGTQAAVMAPTSVLARQYADKLGALLDAAHVSWALVTGATPAPERARTAELLASGELTCVFGTTAILSGDLAFARLTYVVVDEQHRFGVNQRLALREKGPGADLLAMTATPIPRTLALSLYGDIALSRISERPHPGAGVTTRVIPSENADLAIGAIQEAAEAGRQAYVICPLVDDGDDGSELDELPESAKSGAKRPHSAQSTFERLSRGALSGLRVGLLTGRMPADEKDDAMARFKAHETDVLVSTTVVEVGVDVPNATVMLVYDADRFGLATLHQLRGRVGRGELPGEVFLECAAKRGTPARRRLKALEDTTDGFALAELDLKLRREGELLGYRQHGGVSLRIADLDADKDLVEAAHKDAREVAAADPDLSSPEHAPLARECRDRFGAYFEERGEA
jgi:ATP-dependent DNA helicase RecG